MTVGFDRVIQRHWLDHALDLAHRPTDVAVARQALDNTLRTVITSNTSREKTVGILRSIWLDPPAACQTLRNEALGLDRGPSNRTLLHWGMCIASYPFVGTVAEATGRLLRLQETVSISQVRRRVQAIYGDRSTVNKAVPCVLRSFADWGVLHDTDTDCFALNASREVTSPQLAGWLLESALHAKRVDAADFQTLLATPLLFPFQIALYTANQLPPSDRRLVQRQGQTRDVLVLA